MSIRDLRCYVKTLRIKAKEILTMLPKVAVNEEQYRLLVVNFNNTYATIQEYDAIIKQLEAENESKESK